MFIYGCMSLWAGVHHTQRQIHSATAEVRTPQYVFFWFLLFSWFLQVRRRKCRTNRTKRWNSRHWKTAFWGNIKDTLQLSERFLSGGIFEERMGSHFPSPLLCHMWTKTICRRLIKTLDYALTILLKQTDKLTLESYQRFLCYADALICLTHPLHSTSF